jgi:hypothetical protein
MKENGREDMYSGNVCASEKETWRCFVKRSVAVELRDESTLRKGLRRESL